MGYNGVFGDSHFLQLKSLETMFTLFFGDEEASVHKINAGHDLMVKTFVEFIDGVGQQLRVKLITQRETLAADGMEMTLLFVYPPS